MLEILKGFESFRSEKVKHHQLSFLLSPVTLSRIYCDFPITANGLYRILQPLEAKTSRSRKSHSVNGALLF